MLSVLNARRFSILANPTWPVAVSQHVVHQLVADKRGYLQFRLAREFGQPLPRTKSRPRRHLKVMLMSSIIYENVIINNKLSVHVLSSEFFATSQHFVFALRDVLFPNNSKLGPGGR